MICIFREWKGIPILSWNKKYLWYFSSQRKAIQMFFSFKKSFLGRMESLPLGNQKHVWQNELRVFWGYAYEQENSEHFLSFSVGALNMAMVLLFWSCFLPWNHTWANPPSLRWHLWFSFLLPCKMNLLSSFSLSCALSWKVEGSWWSPFEKDS